MNTEKSIRGQRAKDNFNSGYNCSQSVLLAYEDYLQEKGLDPKTVLRMASPMGGGISRLREVYGAVSALCLLTQLSHPPIAAGIAYHTAPLVDRLFS